MEQPSCKETLGMASVPIQQWQEPYAWDTALCEGTIFPDLNLVFHKAPPSQKTKTADARPVNEQERKREAIMQEIYAISFAINDLTLYLDTHPQCPNGSSLYHELMQKRLNLLADFAKEFYPLTQMSAITGNCDDQSYRWTKGPMPWEGGRI